MTRAAGAIVLVLLLSAGCAGPREPLDVKAEDPALKIPAIKKAVESGDRSVLPQLVKDLDSDDPAVRFFAIRALERFTGERMGYEYFQDEQQRKPAVERWQTWLTREEESTKARGRAGTKGEDEYNKAKTSGSAPGQGSEPGDQRESQAVQQQNK